MFNPFFVPLWIRSCFCVNGEKISFPRPDFVDSETAIWGLTSLTDFYKRVQLSFKKRHASDCQKKISFVQITRMKFTFLTPYDIKNVDIKIVLFLFDINTEDIVISKLVSQLKLLPSLIELKDIKKLHETWRNRSFLISEVGKIIRFFLLSQATRCWKWRHLFCFETRKNIPQVNYGKPHWEITDCRL